MKKHSFFILLFLVTLSLSIRAQQPGPMSGEARERIESQRIAFITQKLKLTPDEAKRFWPVYNQHRDAMQEMRDAFERPDLEFISDDEAAKLLEKQMQQEQKRLELRRKFVTDLENILSPKKILMLQQAEMAFNRELLRKVQEHRKP